MFSNKGRRSRPVIEQKRNCMGNPECQSQFAAGFAKHAVRFQAGGRCGDDLVEQGQLAIALLCLCSGRLRSTARFSCPDSPCYRRTKLRELVREQIVERAALHAFYSSLFAHSAGDNDERSCQTALLQDLQRFKRCESWQSIVGEDYLDGWAEVGQKIFPRRNPLPVHIIASQTQFVQYSVYVGMTVLQDHGTKRRGHCSLL